MNFLAVQDEKKKKDEVGGVVVDVCFHYIGAHFHSG